MTDHHDDTSRCPHCDSETYHIHGTRLYGPKGLIAAFCVADEMRHVLGLLLTDQLDAARWARGRAEQRDEDAVKSEPWWTCSRCRENPVRVRGDHCDECDDRLCLNCGKQFSGECECWSVSCP